MSEKLQKVLARAGVGSRREVERWIEQGRVTVDSRCAKLGDRVEDRHTVRIDGRPVTRSAARPRRRVLLYNKPEGELCTRSDPRSRPTVFEHLPRVRIGRWVAVGRLDINTSGLLLFTTDGELANQLMHPSSELERQYAVRVLGEIDKTALQRLTTGVRLDGALARFDVVTETGGEGVNRWYHVTLREGRNREVRRLWEAVGARVSRLIRIRFGPITLPRGLRTGHWVELDSTDVNDLCDATELKSDTRSRGRSNRGPSKRHRRSSTALVTR
ncbi:MAG: 23S rRNA pseudouridine(2605) synthase RluB [Acidiferrobacterales bacterium]